MAKQLWRYFYQTQITSVSRLRREKILSERAAKEGGVCPSIWRCLMGTSQKQVWWGKEQWARYSCVADIYPCDQSDTKSFPLEGQIQAPQKSMPSSFIQGPLSRKVDGWAVARSPGWGRWTGSVRKWRESWGMAMPKIMEEGSSVQLRNLQTGLSIERNSSCTECHPVIQCHMTTVPIL